MTYARGRICAPSPSPGTDHRLEVAPAALRHRIAAVHDRKRVENGGEGLSTHMNMHGGGLDSVAIQAPSEREGGPHLRAHVLGTAHGARRNS